MNDDDRLMHFDRAEYEKFTISFTARGLAKAARRDGTAGAIPLGLTVRFAPNSGAKADILGPPLWATAEVGGGLLAAFRQ